MHPVWTSVLNCFGREKERVLVVCLYLKSNVTSVSSVTILIPLPNLGYETVTFSVTATGGIGPAGSSGSRSARVVRSRQWHRSGKSSTEIPDRVPEFSLLIYPGNSLGNMLKTLAFFKVW
jgi:hypothetical protein